MSERTPNKKTNFDGIDPQESLIKSLESIKSLLKQGDSKINEARQNIARADSISNDSMEIRLNEQSLNAPQSTKISSSSIQKPKSDPVTEEIQVIPELNDNFEDSLEEIIVEAVPQSTIFNSNSTSLEKSQNLSDVPQLSSNSKSENEALSDLYDHDLIVPMLDEVVMPEDQNSSLFNMDSSVDIKIDSKLESTFLDINKNTQSTKSDNIKADLTKTTNSTGISYNTIKKPEINTKADVISFELSSNNKKNSLKKLDSLKHEDEIPLLDLPKSQNSITLVEDSLLEDSLIEDSMVDIDLNPKSSSSIEQVIIKETTNTISQVTDSAIVNTLDSSESKIEKLSATTNNNATDLSPAIATATYTDDVLSNLTKTNKEIISDTLSNPLSESEIDLSNIDGLDNHKFNADKISALQKRVENRVHHRLIQLIVELDEEIKSILTEEINTCISDKVEDSDPK